MGEEEMGRKSERSLLFTVCVWVSSLSHCGEAGLEEGRLEGSE